MATKYGICQNAVCGLFWEIENIGFENWRIVAVNSAIVRIPLPYSVEDVAKLVVGETPEVKWKTVLQREAWNIAATEPCCPHCGSDLEETYRLE